MKRYQIIYQGRLADSKVNMVAAKARAWELATQKGWKLEDIKIVDQLVKTNG